MWRFQYILCYGSTFMLYLCYRRIFYFNTSYVTVQRGCVCQSMRSFCHFNTSYVTVQHWRREQRKPLKEISIHLMLRFNECRFSKTPDASWISIHLMLRFNAREIYLATKAILFQYILCYGSTSIFISSALYSM